MCCNSKGHRPSELYGASGSSEDEVFGISPSSSSATSLSSSLSYYNLLGMTACFFFSMAVSFTFNQEDSCALVRGVPDWYTCVRGEGD